MGSYGRVFDTQTRQDGRFVMRAAFTNIVEYFPATVFSLTRPLRDRTKTMEDIVAFLIEKIEGKAKCKSILGGTYPCFQPSDTVAFRVNATKYMEALRAAVTRQGLQVSTSKRRIQGSKTLQAESASSKVKSLTSSQQSLPDSTTSSSAHETSPIAWWWSAIVVRKSLLEESSGDRFEKLLLALSTHALFVQVPSSSSLHPPNTTTPELTNLLGLQSQEYAKLLSRSLGLHTERAQSAFRLNIRTEELRSRRARLASTPCDDAERVDLQRLLAIRNSKLQALVNAWQTAPRPDVLGAKEEQVMSASDALKWISSIAGISISDAQRDAPLSFAGTFSDIGIRGISPQDYEAAQTLPTASAHHPANRHKLRSLPSLVSLHSDLSINETSDSGSTMSPPALEELLHGASAQKAALEVALNSAVTAGRDIAQRLEATMKNATAMQEQEGLKEFIWGTPAKSTVKDVKVSPMQNPSVMGCLSETTSNSSATDDTQTQRRIEPSVLSVKKSLQPRIPSPPASDVGHSRSQESLQLASPTVNTKYQPSKIPLAISAFTSSSVQSTKPATAASHLIPMTPIPPRPYKTSTPALKSHSKTVRTTRTESRNTDTDDALLTPTDSRGFTAARTDTLKMSPKEKMTDMSLPDFSDANMKDLEIVSSQKFTFARESQQEYAAEREQADTPYEGHSVTLRDILLRAGDGEDSFYLIDDLEDLDEHLGNETIGWG